MTKTIGIARKMCIIIDINTKSILARSYSNYNVLYGRIEKR